MKQFTAVSYDVSHMLKSMPTKHVKVPDNLKVEVVVSLPDEIYEDLRKDPVFHAKAHDKANAKAGPVVEALKKRIADADQKAGRFDAKTAGIFSNDLNAFVKQQLTGVSQEMAKEIEKLFDDYKKSKDRLQKFRIKCVGRIITNAINVVGGAVTGVGAVATLHALGVPVLVNSFLGMLRSGLGIFQESVKLAADADQVATHVQVELDTLNTFMSANYSKTEEKLKTEKIAKAITLEVISGAMGLEVPTLKNCEEHIKVHKAKVAGLKVKLKSLSEQLDKALDDQEALQKQLKDGSLSKDPRLKKLDDGVAKLLEAVEKMTDSHVVEKAEERQEKFENALKAMKTGMPNWIQYTQAAAGAVVDIALALGSATTLLSGAQAAVQAFQSDLATV